MREMAESTRVDSAEGATVTTVVTSSVAVALAPTDSVSIEASLCAH